MSGKILWAPNSGHTCHFGPMDHVQPRGLVWQCDNCGQVWRSLGDGAWRHESRLRRWFRERREARS